LLLHENQLKEMYMDVMIVFFSGDVAICSWLGKSSFAAAMYWNFYFF